MDVGAWLRGLGLGRYEAAFRDADIDGEESEARNSKARVSCARAISIAVRKAASAGAVSAGFWARRMAPRMRWSSASHQCSPVSSASAIRSGSSLAKLYHSTGRDADAHAALAPALEGFSATPEFPEIAEAMALFEALGEGGPRRRAFP